MNDVTPAANSTESRATLRRFLPLLVLLVAIALVFLLGLDQFLSFEALRQHRAELLAFVERNAVLAPLLFVLVYAAVIALSIPGGAILTIAGGFLFGIVLGTLLVVIGATAGATAIFLIARSALGDALRARVGPRVRRMEEGFREDAFNYLLFLRLIPLFPFWLVNIVPALLGVGLGTYVVATFIGIIPGSLVYASVGNGLGAVFDAGETPDLGIIFRPEIILPIAGIAVLALLPVGYRKFKARRAK